MDICESLGLELVAVRVAGALDALETDWQTVSQLHAVAKPVQCR
jgi:hypothetical protein